MDEEKNENIPYDPDINHIVTDLRRKSMNMRNLFPL